MVNCVLINRRRTITAILCYLFMIFLTGCLIGWICEEIFYWIIEGMLRNRGVLYGPWLPIYGIGALGIYALKPLKRHPALLFLMCAVVAGAIEYVIGYMSINLFGLRLWDYRGLFLNIGGIVCFRNVICFGVLGLIFQYLIEPRIDRLYHRLPQNVIFTASAILLLVFIADCVLSALFRTPITY